MSALTLKINNTATIFWLESHSMNFRIFETVGLSLPNRLEPKFIVGADRT